MRTPTGSRWMSNNYITRCHRWLESVSSSRYWSHLGTRCRIESQQQTEGLDPQWPTVEQPSQDEKEVLLWSEELWVNMWQSVPVFNSPLTHYQHQPFRNPFENNVWEVYFFHKEVCSFVHWSHQYVDYVSAYIYIMYVYVAIQH